MRGRQPTGMRRKEASRHVQTPPSRSGLTLVRRPRPPGRRTGRSSIRQEAGRLRQRKWGSCQPGRCDRSTTATSRARTTRARARSSRSRLPTPKDPRRTRSASAQGDAAAQRPPPRSGRCSSTGAEIVEFPPHGRQRVFAREARDEIGQLVHGRDEEVGAAAGIRPGG